MRSATARSSRRLQSFAREHRDEFAIAPDFDKAVKLEAENPGIGAPEYSWPALENASEWLLQTVAGGTKDARRYIAERKAKLQGLDVQLHQKAKEELGSITPENIVRFIEGDCVERTNMIIERAAELTGLSVETILRKRARFKVAHATANLVQRQLLANVVDPSAVTETAHRHLLGLHRTKAAERGMGSWYDAYIAGSCGHLDVFVTADTNLRNRCEWHRKRGLLTFETVLAKEFLPQLVAAPAVAFSDQS